MDSSELAELDAAVARAQGWKVVNFSEGRDGVYSVPDDPHSFVGYLQPECPPPWFRPSTDWSQGGPLLEQERIELRLASDGEWYANMLDDPPGFRSVTPLIAAMRAFVASKK